MDCCAPKDREAESSPCPGCGQVGRPAAGVTVEAILRPGRALGLLEPRLCRTRDCGVLYYGADGRSVHKQDASARVGLKESDAPLPVCYCFGFSRADIEREIA